MSDFFPLVTNISVGVWIGKAFTHSLCVNTCTYSYSSSTLVLYGSNFQYALDFSPLLQSCWMVMMIVLNPNPSVFLHILFSLCVSSCNKNLTKLLSGMLDWPQAILLIWADNRECFVHSSQNKWVGECEEKDFSSP